MLIAGKNPVAPRPAMVVDVDAEQNVNLDLDYNIQDERLNAIVKQMGLTSLRNVQAVAIQKGLFFRQSLLVFSPSGSGKTLVGELAAVNSVIESFGKAAYLVPLKALATEKYKHFLKYYGCLGIKIEISIGDYDLPPEDLAAADLVIMTYEKLDSMLRSARGNLVGTFGCLVIDEIHVMGEQERGPRLESLVIRATRALGDVQVIALSATVANPIQLNEWLSHLGHETILLLSKERPVPLEHEVVVARDNVSAINEILEKVAAEGGQCLIFTRSRRRAELLSRQLAATCASCAPPETYQARVELAFRAKRGSKYTDLPPLLVKGISYHHAGLSTQERDLVEHAFLNRHILAICCTTTLSAGINMPARAVILEDYKQFTVHEKDVVDKKRFMQNGNTPTMFKPIPRNTFHQIVGRAGRAGFDDKGSAYVLVHSRDEAKWIEEYYFAKGADGTLEPAYDPLQSAMSNRHVMLEQLLVFANEVQTLTYADVKAFFSMSFYNHMLGAKDQPMDTALRIRHATARDLVAGVTSPPGTSVTILEASTSRVAGAIADPATSRRSECQLTAAGGYACTCGAKPGGGFRGACDHLRLLVKEVLAERPGLEHAIGGMLAAALREECYVDFLVDNGFLDPTGEDEYRCTPFGSLVARLYVYPTIAVFIKRRLLERVSNPDPGPFEPWFYKLVKDVQDEQNSSYSSSLFHAAWHWMEEGSMDLVLEPFREPIPALRTLVPAADDPVYPGDFNNFKADLQRWARVAGKIAQHLGMSAIEVDCSQLERRVEHGVRAELFPLVENLTGVGRIRGRMLFRAGCRTIEAVQDADPESLSKATGLPEQTCTRVINSAREWQPVEELDDVE